MDGSVLRPQPGLSKYEIWSRPTCPLSLEVTVGVSRRLPDAACGCRCPSPFAGDRADRAAMAASEATAVQRPTSASRSAHHSEQAGEVTHLPDLYRTQPHRLEKRVGDGGRSRPTHERPSDKVSDNHHGQRWTPADTHGRSSAGHPCCGAGSPRRYLASGRRGHLGCRIWLRCINQRGCAVSGRYSPRQLCLGKPVQRAGAVPILLTPMIRCRPIRCSRSTSIVSYPFLAGISLVEST